MYGKSVKHGVLKDYIHRTYRMEAELGSGGSGNVYKAWHTRLRKYVVIKITKKCLTGCSEQFRNEAEALKKIKNIHIPQVYDFIDESDYCLTVMEYIDGDSFDILLRNGIEFSKDRIIKWYIQLASALNVIHNNDVFHRDIKPANIILTTNDDVCLIDFNSAYVTGNNTGMTSRSMGYASPEQYDYYKRCKTGYINNAPVISLHYDFATQDNECMTEIISSTDLPFYSEVSYLNHIKTDEINWIFSDIYSLGATMFHLMTGKRPPVKADDIVGILNLPDHPVMLLKTMERSMRFDPGERFKSAGALYETLKYFRLQSRKPLHVFLN